VQVSFKVRRDSTADGRCLRARCRGIQISIVATAVAWAAGEARVELLGQINIIFPLVFVLFVSPSLSNLILLSTLSLSPYLPRISPFVSFSPSPLSLSLSFSLFLPLSNFLSPSLFLCPPSLTFLLLSPLPPSLSPTSYSLPPPTFHPCY